MAEQSKSPATITTAGSMAKMVKFGEALKSRATIEESDLDGKEIAANIAAKILEAESFDDIFKVSEGGMPGGRDLVGIEQRVESISVRMGKNGDVPPNELVGGTFLVVHAVRLDTGEPIVWDTSATQLVAQLIAIERHDALSRQKGESGYLPTDVVIVDVGGKGALALRQVAKRVVK
jgi:hypothetical protein